MPSLIYDADEVARLEGVVASEEEARSACAKAMHDLAHGKDWTADDIVPYKQLEAKEALHRKELNRVSAHLEKLRAIKPRTAAEIRHDRVKPFNRWMEKGEQELSADERIEQQDLILTFGDVAHSPSKKFVIPFDKESMKPGVDLRQQSRERAQERDRNPESAATSPQQAGLALTIEDFIDQNYIWDTEAYGGALQAFSSFYTPDGVDREFLISNDTGSATGPTANWGTAQIEGPLPTEMDKIKIAVQMYTTNWVDIQRYAYEDLAWNVGEWARAIMMRRMGKKLEEQAASGSGAADNPRGFITAAKGYSNVAGGAGKFRWEDSVRIEHDIEYSNLFGAEEGLYGWAHMVGKTCYMTSWQFMSVLRLLRDGDGRPLYQPNIHSRTIFDLNGYPIHLCHEFSSANQIEGNGKKPLVFGNFAHMVQRFAGAGFMIEQFYDSATALSNNNRLLGRLRWGCGLAGPYEGTKDTSSMKSKSLRLMTLTT